MILCLETATNLCSVALCERSGVVNSRESSDSRSHASLLTIFAGQVLDEAGIRPSDLQAIAVSKGPGSYTGLRIGVSVAKGIAFAASVPLIGIVTTYSMFHGLKYRIQGKKRLFCPVLDARRMEFYYAIYDSEGNTVKEISAEVIGENSLAGFTGNNDIIVFGNGAAKLKTVISDPAVKFVEDFHMSASHMAEPAFNALDNHVFEDVAYFEPLYLKDFIATKPKKSILGT